MTNTDERVHYGFYYSDTIRPQTLSLHLIKLDGKLIKVFSHFHSSLCKTGGEESTINSRSESVRVRFLEPECQNAGGGNRLNKLWRFFICVWQKEKLAALREIFFFFFFCVSQPSREKKYQSKQTPEGKVTCSDLTDFKRMTLDVFSITEKEAGKKTNKKTDATQLYLKAPRVSVLYLHNFNSVPN